MDSENTTSSKQKTLRPWQSTENSPSENTSNWDAGDDFQMQLLKRLSEQKLQRINQQKEKELKKNTFIQLTHSEENSRLDQEGQTSFIDWSQASSWPIEVFCQRVYNKWFADLENL